MSRTYFPSAELTPFSGHEIITWEDLGIPSDYKDVALNDIERLSLPFTIHDSETRFSTYDPPEGDPTQRRFNTLLVTPDDRDGQVRIRTQSKAIYQQTVDARRTNHYPMRACAVWRISESSGRPYMVLVPPPGEGN